MIYFKVWSLPQVNESASMNLMQTWYCLLLHHYESNILWKGYSLALTKQLSDLRALWNKTMGRGVNTLFTSLSLFKILRFLSIIARRGFSKRCYVTIYSIPFILWCLSLLFNLKLENAFHFRTNQVLWVLRFPELRFHFLFMIFETLLWCT